MRNNISPNYKITVKIKLTLLVRIFRDAGLFLWRPIRCRELFCRGVEAKNSQSIVVDDVGVGVGKTISVLVPPLRVMDLFVEFIINVFRSQLIALLLEPNLYDNVHLLVQKLLDLQEDFNQFITDYESAIINSMPATGT